MSPEVLGGPGTSSQTVGDLRRPCVCTRKNVPGGRDVRDGVRDEMTLKFRGEKPVRVTRH